MSSNARAVVTLLIGILIFVGLPLLGWGIADFSGFAANKARVGYIILVILIQVSVVVTMPDAGQNRGAGQSTSTSQKVNMLLLQIIPLALMVAAPYSDGHDTAAMPQSDLWRYAGLVLFAAGMGGMHWAEVHLGKQFSVEVTIQEDHKLITSGPYRRLRHPRYLGILLFAIGFSLVFRSWLGLLLVAALSVILIWRIVDEEAMMHRQFGADWEAYAQRSWRLIPYLY